MAEDGSILVNDCETGYESQYGMVNVVDYVTYSEKTDAPSYYDPETGVFNFAVSYYVSAGTLGSGYETFALTGKANAKSRIAKADKEVAKKNVSCKLILTLKNDPINAIPVIR